MTDRENNTESMVFSTDYTIWNYSVRKKGDHYQSYNVITGEGLYEAQTLEEAWADLREEFAEGA